MDKFADLVGKTIDLLVLLTGQSCDDIDKKEQLKFVERYFKFAINCSSINIMENDSQSLEICGY